MKNLKFVFKIIAAILVVSAAVCTIMVFKNEFIGLISGFRKKLEDRKNSCCGDFADFDDV